MSPMSGPGSDVYLVEIATVDTLHAKFKAAFLHAEMMLRNGERVLLKCGPGDEPVRVRQRKFLKDTVFGQIAEQVEIPTFDHLGNATGRTQRYTKKAWAELFRDRLLGNRYEEIEVPGHSESVVKEVPISSEELGVRGYSEYTDRVIDHAVVEYGVVFHFTTQEREAVRYVRKPSKEKQQ